MKHLKAIKIEFPTLIELKPADKLIIHLDDLSYLIKKIEIVKPDYQKILIKDYDYSITEGRK